MEKKNIYTTLFVILGVLLIFGTGLYAGWAVKSVKMTEGFRILLKHRDTGAQTANQEAEQEESAISQERKSVLSFLPLSGQRKLGQSFETKVILDTQEQKTYGVDVLVNYDPMMLELGPQGEQSGASQGGVKIVKSWAEGKIIFSSLAAARATWQNEVELAALVFMPKRLGPVDLKFVFEEGSTTDCNVAGPGGKDILDKVYDAHFEVVE